MKQLLVEIPSGCLLHIPSELAAVAAGLLVQGTLVTKKDYRNKFYSPAPDEQISIQFVDTSELEVPSEREKKLAADLEAKNVDWAKAYNADSAKDREITELKAQLDAIKSVTVCTVSEDIDISVQMHPTLTTKVES